MAYLLIFLTAFLNWKSWTSLEVFYRLEKCPPYSIISLTCRTLPFISPKGVSHCTVWILWKWFITQLVCLTFKTCTSSNVFPKNSPILSQIDRSLFSAIGIQVWIYKLSAFLEKTTITINFLRRNSTLGKLE